MIELTIGDIVAGLALLLSIYATWRSHRFKKREHEFLDLQEQVSELVLAKESREAREARTADLGANFITLGSKRHRLKVFNKGRAAAHNVQIDFPDGNDLVIQGEIDEKFPMESMEPGQAVDLSAIVTMGSRRKLAVVLTWTDQDGTRREKAIHVTL